MLEHHPASARWRKAQSSDGTDDETAMLGLGIGGCWDWQNQRSSATQRNTKKGEVISYTASKNERALIKKYAPFTMTVGLVGYC